MTVFTLPELGENITDGDVLRVLVKVGDTVALDQPVVELETDKATIEVPVSVAGRVTDVKVKAGDKVKVGQLILSVEEGGAGAAGPSAPADPAAAAPARPTPPAPPEPAQPTPPADNVVAISRGVRLAPDAAPAGRTARAGRVAPATPSVRRMARELGVNIDDVAGTESDGRISVEDVKAHARRLLSRTTAGAGADAVGQPIAPEPLPDFSRWGEIERQPIGAVRRKTAEHLGASWPTIPLVTQYDLADITEFEEVRKRHTARVGHDAPPLTVTALAVKVATAALDVFPQLNVSIDMAAREIIVKKYVNIGVAVATERGLLVPVVRDPRHKSLLQISSEVAALAEKARNRKITLDEMAGATFSISNLGGIGGTAFTPLVNAPEVAILGIARARTEPVFKDGQFVPRLMLPLALSYDHRAIDGALGAQFLRWVAERFEHPLLLTLEAEGR